MKRSMCCVAGGGLLVALVVLAVPGGPADHAGTAAEGKGAGVKDDPAPAAAKGEEAAIRKATAGFIQAVEKGDAKAAAAAWTGNGEYIAADGTITRGRAALEAAYAKVFAEHKKLVVKIRTDSIRFPSKDTAIEEGHAQRFKADSDHPTTSRYSVLHVREGGRWLMAVLREWPDEGESLADFEWLIGTWEAKTDQATVRTTYEWDARKNSIRCHITIKGKDRNVSGLQVLLKDPRTEQLRSWLFDDEGGFGEGAWTNDGKRWLIAATGVRPDGGEVTATNILTRIDKDTFLWQSTECTLDGEELPNIPPVKVTRVK